MGFFPSSRIELKLRIFRAFFVFVLVLSPLCGNEECLKSPRVKSSRNRCGGGGGSRPGRGALAGELQVQGPIPCAAHCLQDRREAPESNSALK